MNAQEQEKERHATLLREYLERSGVKQQELARRIGVTAPNITDWVSKKRPVPVRRAKKIEQVTCGAIRRCDLFPDLFD
jgi:DNA-binding transcriptional regulator YdaS (Cro superfamily)